MLKCPQCDKEIEKTEVQVHEITEEHIEIEVSCTQCNETVMWTRIHPDEWINYE